MKEPVTCVDIEVPEVVTGNVRGIPAVGLLGPNRVGLGEEAAGKVVIGVKGYLVQCGTPVVIRRICQGSREAGEMVGQISLGVPVGCPESPIATEQLVSIQVDGALPIIEALRHSGRGGWNPEIK